MLGFIIPFKSKNVSRDWRADNEMLKRTVGSILNQSDPDFKVYIVYTDMPEIAVNDPRVRFVKTPYPFLKFEQMQLPPDVLEFHKSERMIEKRFDKGKKLTYGGKLAKEDGCDYLMGVDADDLLSGKIVAFVKTNNKNKVVPGWYIDEGYMMKEGSGKLTKQRNMHYINGSTHILRADLVDVPDDATAGFHDYSLFTAHGWIKERLQETKKAELLRLPFRGVIYMVHQNNISDVGAVMFSRSVKNVIKNILRKTPVNDSLRAEFNIGH